MPAQVYVIIGLLLLLGLVFAWMAFRRIFDKRLASGTVHMCLSVLLIGLSVGSVGISANLYTYQRLVVEQAIGKIRFEAYAPQEFIATFTRPDGTEQQYSIFGDEIQMDARLLKWKGAGNLLGFETLYRLERLSGRYTRINEEQENARSVHNLSEDAGIEFWDLVNQYSDWLPWIDAIYGNAMFVPMQNKAQYTLTMANSGLIARPANKAAENALKRWK